MSAKLTTRFAYTATKDAPTISLRAIEGTQTSLRAVWLYEPEAKSVRSAKFYSADVWLNEQGGESPLEAQATGPVFRSIRSKQPRQVTPVLFQPIVEDRRASIEKAVR